MALPIIRIVGNLVADPELRFTPNGIAVVSLRIAASDRKKEGDTWVDGPSTFLTVKAWRQLAENVAESLQKGDRVLAFGRLRQEEFQTRDGEKRTSLELDAEDIGPALSRCAAKPARTDRSKPSASEPDRWAQAEPGF